MCELDWARDVDGRFNIAEFKSPVPLRLLVLFELNRPKVCAYFGVVAIAIELCDCDSVSSAIESWSEELMVSAIEDCVGMRSRTGSCLTTDSSSSI